MKSSQKTLTVVINCWTRPLLLSSLQCYSLLFILQLQGVLQKYFIVKKMNWAHHFRRILKEISTRVCGPVHHLIEWPLPGCSLSLTHGIDTCYIAINIIETFCHHKKLIYKSCIWQITECFLREPEYMGWTIYIVTS